MSTTSTAIANHVTHNEPLQHDAATTDRESSRARLEDALIGSILGTAVGDAIGLPYEGLSRRRAQKMLGPPNRYRLFFRRGLVSDDTEQTCLVAQSLIESFGDVGRFQRRLLRRLRGWFLTLPAGVGLGTSRAMLKSLIGFPLHRCGVFSAGNGPAMRSSVIGAVIDDPSALKEFVQASCTITHTDPKALYGAWAVALAANLARSERSIETSEYLSAVRGLISNEPAEELLQSLECVVQSVQQGQSTMAFTASVGMEQGVSGYVYQTVPVAIHAWLTNQNDFETAVTSVVQCGGDTDTTAAIVGGIVGCHVGKAGIPQAWRNELAEWPRTTAWMEVLARQLARVVASRRAEKPPSSPLVGVLARNLVFLVIVLVHGFRRLLPPY